MKLKLHARETQAKKKIECRRLNNGNVLLLLCGVDQHFNRHTQKIVSLFRFFLPSIQIVHCLLHWHDSLVCSLPLQIKWLLQHNAIVHCTPYSVVAQVNKAGGKSSMALDFQFELFFFNAALWITLILKIRFSFYHSE